MMLFLPLVLSLQLTVGQPNAAIGVVSVDSLSLSLQDAVARALLTGDEARAAAALVDVTDAQLTIARAAGLPQLRVTASPEPVAAMHMQMLEDAGKD